MANPQVTINTGGIGLDLRDFSRFAKALRKAEPALAKGLAVRLRAAGEIVAAEARSNAAAISKSIPPSIKVRVSGATVSVVAGGNGVPLAGLLELGNAGRTSSTATNESRFRHPVFGHSKVWVNQPMHPYLLPALRNKSEVAQQAAVDALDEAIAIIVTDPGV